MIQLYRYMAVDRDNLQPFGRPTGMAFRRG
jgi:hypothetical protein